MTRQERRLSRLGEFIELFAKDIGPGFVRSSGITVSLLETYGFLTRADAKAILKIIEDQKRAAPRNGVARVIPFNR